MPADGPHSVARHLLPPAPATPPPLYPCRQQLPTIPLCLSRAAHRTGGFRTDHFTPRCPRHKGGNWGKCVFLCIYDESGGGFMAKGGKLNKNNTRSVHASVHPCMHAQYKTLGYTSHLVFVVVFWFFILLSMHSHSQVTCSHLAKHFLTWSLLFFWLYKPHTPFSHMHSGLDLLLQNIFFFFLESLQIISTNI